MRLFLQRLIIIAGYAVLLSFAALTIPLRIPEILQVAASRGFESLSMPAWIAQAPDSAPLNYFVQLPFLLALGYTRLGARLDSLLFALAACYVFFRLVRRIGIAHPILAVMVFLLLPVHAQLASQGLPFEQGLFFLLLATEWFLRLLERPQIGTAVVYTVLLTLCAYSDSYAFLPAIGYLLFLLVFVNRAQERRALWFGLSATVAAAILFLPYYAWAAPQVNPYWPTRPDLYGNALERAAGNEQIGFVLLALFAMGILTAAGGAIRWGAAASPKRVSLVCLLGGAISAFVLTPVLDFALGESFTPDQLLWATPALVLVVFAGIERFASRGWMRALVPLFAGMLILLCAAGNYFERLLPAEDTEAEAALIAPELTSDACVVFVSERFSKPLFQLFQPGLKERECLTFSHERIVLASHPYVGPEQQTNAESFFRGLNFSETKRIRSGGGQIVIMQQIR